MRCVAPPNARQETDTSRPNGNGVAAAVGGRRKGTGRREREGGEGEENGRSTTTGWQQNKKRTESHDFTGFMGRRKRWRIGSHVVIV